MALHVYTAKCREDAEIRVSSEIQYNVGVMLMVLGMDEISDKTLTEALCRFELYAKMENLSGDQIAHYRHCFKDAVGVEINGNRETWNKFAKRVCDIHRNRYARMAA
jgi:hypothetical protein